MLDQFSTFGWCRFPHDEQIMRWVDAALPLARACVSAPENRQWFRCGGTWFVGVNVLPNNNRAVISNTELKGSVIDFINQHICNHSFDWDAGQISVCYPGYPKPMPSESDKAFIYRRDRNAAHVDGLLREGPQMRRHLREHHGFILGLPLVESSPGASPLVVWEKSHEVVRKTFADRFADLPSHQWGDVDVTEMYLELRYEVFKQCKPVEIFARPGESFLLHRLCVHGMSPWQEGASAGPDGRMICYFRPEYGGPEHWLHAD